MTRAELAAALAAEATLSGWTHYAEPPAQLAAGPCMVVAPQAPYVTWNTFTTPDMHVVVHLLVPRTSSVSMDLIDSGLVALRSFLLTLDGAAPGDVVTVGTLDEVGAITYTAAMLAVELPA